MIKTANSRLLASVIGLAALTPIAHAQVTVVAFGTTPTTGNGGYVTSSPSFQRLAAGVAEGDGTSYSRRNTFSDTSVLNPLTSSPYVGPTFYGGYEIITTGTGLTGTPSAIAGGILGSQRVGNSTIDAIQVFSPFTTAWNTSTTVASFAGLFMFKQADWRDTSNAPSSLNSGGVNISSFGSFFTTLAGNTSFNAGVVTRWIVQDNGGQYYVSQNAAVSGATLSMSATNWMAVTPATSGSMNLNLTGTYSVSGATMGSISLTSVGIYVENDSFGAVGTGTQFVFQLNSLGFSGVAAIPESSTFALFCGIGGLVAVAARRRRCPAAV